MLKKSHSVFSDSAMGFLCKMNFFTLAVLPTLPRFQQVSAKHARILWYRPTLPKPVWSRFNMYSTTFAIFKIMPAEIA